MKIVWVKQKPLLILLLILLTSLTVGFIYINYGKDVTEASTSEHIVKESPAAPNELSKTISNEKDSNENAISANDVGERNQKEDVNKKREDVWRREEALLDDVKSVLKKSPSEVAAEIDAEKESVRQLERVKEDARLKEVVIEEVHPFGVTGGIPSDPEIKAKQDFIRNMMKHAWKGYRTYAWGSNELRPSSKKGHSSGIFGSGNSGATIIDAIDTLYLMGLTDEYEDARNWIATSFSFDPKGDVSIFETNIRFIGGLLSIYAMTGDRMFRLKAEEVARKLLPAFSTSTGIPKSLINLKTHTTKNYPWASGGSCILSEMGTLQLELDYLSYVSGDPIFAEKVDKINRHLRSIVPPSNLYSNYVNPNTGKWGTSHYSVGALGDSFYEYLVKGWILHSKTDSAQRQEYDAAAKAIKSKLVQTKQGLTYVAEMKGSRLVHKMDHLACFVGGMFALGGSQGVHLEDSAAGMTKEMVNEDFIQLGKAITNTCHESYTRTNTKIGPEAFHFDGTSVASTTRSNEKQYLLRPEVVESYFVLWRVTKDPKYRQWGWEAATAFETYCRKDAGYSGIRDVNAQKPASDDVQQSFFLAETLKYLYLLFSDDSLVPLSHWVFNTEAHPIPIIPESRMT